MAAHLICTDGAPDRHQDIAAFLFGHGRHIFFILQKTHAIILFTCLIRHLTHKHNAIFNTVKLRIVRHLQSHGQIAISLCIQTQSAFSGSIRKLLIPRK